MADDGAALAWWILRRRGDYRTDWRGRTDGGALPGDGAPGDGPAGLGAFPVRRQSADDLGAVRWGLLAWEDPFDEAGPASPFWAVAPMLDAMPAPPDGAGLTALLQRAGTALAGLVLADGALILKLERNGLALQLRIADGAGFDAAGGGFEVRTRYGPAWPERHVLAGAVWQVAGLPAPPGGRVRWAGTVSSGRRWPGF